MNKILLIAGLLCVASLANAGGTVDVSKNDWRHVRPKIEVQVKRMATADTYVVTATLSDLKSGQVLSQPKLITHAGAPARIQVGEKGTPGSVLVDIDVTVAPSGSTATYVSEVRDNNEVVSSQVLTLAVSN